MNKDKLERIKGLCRKGLNTISKEEDSFFTIWQLEDLLKEIIQVIEQ
jgi:hypothetical protein